MMGAVGQSYHPCRYQPVSVWYTSKSPSVGAVQRQ